MAEDYYSLLGVDPDASEDAILRAYRERAAEHHPDVSDADDAEETFQRLNRARDVLTDPKRRREYDRVGHDRFVEGSRERPPGDGPVDVGTGAVSTGPFDGGPADIGSFFELLFASPGRRRTERARASRRRSRASPYAPGEVDLRGHLNRSAPAGQDPEAASGAGGSRSAPSGARTACPRCRGRGSFVHVIDTARGRRRRLEPCEECGGSGSVPA